ncbi:MAG: DUF2457 domain-containing protein [bacterium]|nr:DUF2457 domain-containing protein [bacterium]
MKPLLLVLTLPLLVAPRDEIRFQPTEGLELTKTFERKTQRENTSTSERGGDSTQSSSAEYVLVVTDTIVNADDERIAKLERTFDTATAEIESSFVSERASVDNARSASSEIEEATVVFEWDEDEEEYVASSEDADDEAIEELLFDYDFTALLPGEEVDEDDSWEMEIEDFKDMLDPWKGHPFEWESSDGEVTEASAPSDEGDRPEPEIDESEDGEITVTYSGTREEDGVTYAVLTITGEIETERTVDFSSDEGDRGNTMHQEATETRTIEGEALWAIEAGHLAELEIEVETSMTQSMENTFRFGDREFSSSSEGEGTSSSTFTAVFAAPE